MNFAKFCHAKLYHRLLAKVNKFVYIVNMLNPANIHRSRRRTLSIFINPMGELVVHAPENMPDRKIFDFVRSRGDWIRERLDAVTQNSYINRNVASYNTFFYLGQELVPVVSTAVKTITPNMNALLIPAKIEPDKIQKKVEKFFRDMAKTVISDRCAYFGGVLKLKHSSCTTNNNKTRWGCCTRSGEIAINWRAIFLRPDVLDYIIVHEFCHLLEFNHTKNFWAIVETILPNWRKLRLDLKRLSWLLQLFRA